MYIDHRTAKSCVIQKNLEQIGINLIIGDFVNLADFKSLRRP